MKLRIVFSILFKLTVAIVKTEELSLVGVRRTLTRFERAVNKNQDQRSKYPDDPTK